MRYKYSITVRFTFAISSAYEFLSRLLKSKRDKNSYADEIANVNIFKIILHTYFKKTKKEPILFSKLNDS